MSALVEYPYQSSVLNDSLVPALQEDEIPRVLGGAELTESRQSQGTLGAERAESSQFPGYLEA